MKMLIAPASMKGTISNVQFANAIEEGLRKAGFNEIVKLPVADGGDDTALVLAGALNARFIPAEVQDPLGRNIRSGFYLNDEGTAIVEMAAASGLRLLKREEYSALRTSSYGTGQLIRAAVENGANKILLGVGGSATVDAGMGALLALGFRFFDGRGMIENGNGFAAGHVVGIESDHILTGLRNVEISILSDVDNPMLGINGAANIFAPQKGATPNEVKILNKNLSLFAGVIYQMTGNNVASHAGGGAAGGIAASLHALLGAKIENGSEYLLNLLGFYNHAKNADTIITGEGCFDFTSFSGKVTGAIIKFGTKIEKPVYIICGTSTLNDEKWSDKIFPIVDGSVSLDEAMNNTYENVVNKTVSFGIHLKNSSMNNKVILAEQEFVKGNFEDCRILVNEIISQNNTNLEALMLRSKLNYKIQNWGEALNDLNRIIELDSSHELAKNYRQMVLNILTYWNKDNFNP